METPDKKLSELVGLVKSWIPRRIEPPNASMNFWMPDQSFRVCYECDSQFTIFNRRHHCRSFGRLFCAKCTSNSIPVSSDDPKNSREEGERIRICNHCSEQWTKEIASANNGILQISSLGLSPSPSSASLASSECNGHSSSTVNSTPYHMRPYHCVTHGAGRSPQQSTRTEFVSDLPSLGRNRDSVLDIGETSPTQSVLYQQTWATSRRGEGHDNECDAAQSIYGAESADAEPVDFENIFLLWFPPDPEDEEDEREAIIFDDDHDALAEWGNFSCSSGLSSSENRTRDHSSEEHRRAMKNVVDGHFRALVAQFLQVDNLPIDEEDGKEGWLDIVTSLSWEAASLLKPVTSKGGGMDPGGYVKVKCLASSHCSESKAVKGIVCKKNVAHGCMT